MRVRALFHRLLICGIPALVLALGACSDEPGPAEPTLDAPSTGADVLPSSDDFWPFTGRSPRMEDPADPINLVFLGEASPRQIRSALLSLDGNRSPVFPPVFPFNCTWKDAMGAAQTAFSDAGGWTPNVIQLECGEYDPLRFHVRIFDLGELTVANAHFDLLIPGTTDHQVIAWEAAEQLVTFDFGRSGLLGAPPAATDPINPAPTYREIPAVIYNGIPASLRAFIGGPPGDVTDPVGIVTDGRATVFTLAGSVPEDLSRVVREQTLEFGQTIPKPFCSQGALDFVRVEGPVHLSLDVHPTPGALTHGFRARGALRATPVNPLTGEVVGETFEAQVHDDYEGTITPTGAGLTGSQIRILLPPSEDGRGRFHWRMRVSPEGPPVFSVTEDCGSG